jgi:hypothetical protein
MLNWTPIILPGLPITIEQITIEANKHRIYITLMASEVGRNQATQTKIENVIYNNSRSTTSA